ncbi:Peptidoglycan/LPS O-acetylase OafA/YrhL, contains acyltransferase and SGNH-hydrolase domains [Sinosporangium album]|uniref:Peptidoglycan/LPS O-acetylase OafA/YrhL, contains acyltransferase and SGNH-hydrolase domains n=1 Tax=Sinosporangium album TaxID=504805 RepID=A0A1G8GC75_9ACTN|nr:acyltransferase [Sinosporangium album]SDH91967.1 Peptidoglycan/LPS O-acetylase OafA/YrhL, contains acyltransferase and SGNH-hydrolase domains [Sinosporangium album]
MAWLDALRGVAAVMVVVEHSFGILWYEARHPVKAVFETGWYGVMVFFLVSGYIIPASLERRGSVRAFWISRFFRLYPLFGVCLAGVALLMAAGWEVHIWWSDRLESLTLGHLTMLQNLLNMPNLVNVLWTLSYEMAFYLLVTAMFALGWHRRSTAAAVGFAAAAVLGAGVLPVALLSTGGSGRVLAVTLTVTALLVAGLAAVLAGSGAVRRAGAAVIGVTVVGLLAFNQTYPGPGLGLLVLATMFAGTVLYRAEKGEISWRQAGWVVLVPAAGLWLADGHSGFQAAIAAAWITFAAGMALRHRAVPQALAWLGLISYSLYLLHPLFLKGVELIWPDHRAAPLGLRLTALLGMMGLLIAVSALTWRFVEAPAQRLGKRLAART